MREIEELFPYPPKSLPVLIPDIKESSRVIISVSSKPPESDNYSAIDTRRVPPPVFHICQLSLLFLYIEEPGLCPATVIRMEPHSNVPSAAESRVLIIMTGYVPSKGYPAFEPHSAS